LMEQEHLLGFRLRIARHDQPAPVGGGQADIEHLNRGQFFQHGAGCQPRGAGGQSLLERDRQGISQEGHKDVGFHAFLHLMIDGTQAEFTLQSFEGRFDLGQEDVEFPEHFRLFHQQVRAQQIMAIA